MPQPKASLQLPMQTQRTAQGFPGVFSPLARANPRPDPTAVPQAEAESRRHGRGQSPALWPAVHGPARPPPEPPRLAERPRGSPPGGKVPSGPGDFPHRLLLGRRAPGLSQRGASASKDRAPLSPLGGLSPVPPPPSPPRCAWSPLCSPSFSADPAPPSPAASRPHSPPPPPLVQPELAPVPAAAPRAPSLPHSASPPPPRTAPAAVSPPLAGVPRPALPPGRLPLPALPRGSPSAEAGGGPAQQRGEGRAGGGSCERLKRRGQPSAAGKAEERSGSLSPSPDLYAPGRTAARPGEERGGAAA